MIDAKTIQKLRQETGVGVMDIKKALVEANGDEGQALEVLKKKAKEIAIKKQAERTASEGIIATYVHNNNKMAAMVVLNCETDFVAKNEKFKALGRDLAMQVVGMGAKYVKLEDAPAGTSEEVCLLKQTFIKDGEKTVEEVINEAIAKLGEKIEVREIVKLIV